MLEWFASCCIIVYCTLSERTYRKLANIDILKHYYIEFQNDKVNFWATLESGANAAIFCI